MIKIGVLDDHKTMTDLLLLHLESKSSDIAIYTFNNSIELYNYFETDKLDFLLLDIYIGNEIGIEILKECRKKFRATELKIIILSSSIESKVIADSLKHGANAYMAKLDPFDEIAEIIKKLLNNPTKKIVSNSVSSILLEYSFDENRTKLSPREEELLALICNAKTTKEIAEELNLSVNTIHNYTNRLMVKMGVNRTVDLVLKAIEKGYYFSH